MSFDEHARRLPRHELSEDAKRRHRDLLASLDEDDAPGENRTPEGVAAGQRERARDLVPRAGRRRRGLAIGAAVLVLGGAGIGTAAALGAFSSEPTDRGVAYCYAQAAVDGPRVTFSVAGAPDQTGDSAASALSICRKQWGTGAVRGSEPYLVRDVDVNQPPSFPVPDLAVCVLDEGAVAVFPGRDSVCAQLGLANATL